MYGAAPVLMAKGAWSAIIARHAHGLSQHVLNSSFWLLVGAGGGYRGGKKAKVLEPMGIRLEKRAIKMLSRALRMDKEEPINDVIKGKDLFWKSLARSTTTNAGEDTQGQTGS